MTYKQIAIIFFNFNLGFPEETVSDSYWLERFVIFPRTEPTNLSKMFSSKLKYVLTVDWQMFLENWRNNFLNEILKLLIISQQIDILWVFPCLGMNSSLYEYFKEIPMLVQ